jgi:SAM-dependent methyltransferase
MGVICEICAGPARHVFEARGHQMYRCDACRYAFTSPPPQPPELASIYDDDYFAGGGAGAGYPDYVAEGPLLRERGKRYGDLLRRHLPPAGAERPRVLDVGAAAGFILQGYHDAGWGGIGIELNASMAAYGRERLGFDVRTGTLESLEIEETFEAISFLQVAAHFADPRAALERAARLTRPSGLWIFETWNCESLTARAFGRSWHAYAPPSAVRAFSPRALDVLAGSFGFERVGQGSPRKVIDAKHAKSVLSATARTSLVMRGVRTLVSAVPDRTKLSYFPEDVFWALYRRR